MEGAEIPPMGSSRNRLLLSDGTGYFFLMGMWSAVTSGRSPRVGQPASPGTRGFGGARSRPRPAVPGLPLDRRSLKGLSRVHPLLPREARPDRKLPQVHD